MNFRKLAVHHLRPGRVIRYGRGDVLHILFNRQFQGFGVHFAPIEVHSAWKVRVANSSVGLQSYAQGQRFVLDGKHLQLESAGDETIEVLRQRSGYILSITAEHSGQLRLALPLRPAYQPPAWAYDFWFSTPAARITEQEVRQEIATAHQRRLHPTVWLFDANWESHQNFLQFDAARFPSSDGFLREVRDVGVRPIMWVPPWIPAKTPLWDFFDRQHWFAKDTQGKSLVFPVTGSMGLAGSYLDFTSKELVAYFTEHVRMAIDRGIAGFMSDFGEVLPDEAVLACTTEAAAEAKARGVVGHNWYIDEIKRILHQAVEGRDVCIISRAGWTDSYRHTGLWLGDQSSDNSRFAGLISVGWGYYSAMQDGYKFIGMDIGGYFGRPTLKDYKHWMDLAICMPFAMHHGSIHANPWEEGEAALAHHRWARKKHAELWQQPHQKPLFHLDQGGQRLRAIDCGDHTLDLTTVLD